MRGSSLIKCRLGQMGRAAPQRFLVLHGLFGRCTGSPSSGEAGAELSAVDASGREVPSYGAPSPPKDAGKWRCTRAVGDLIGDRRRSARAAATGVAQTSRLP